MEEDSSLCFVGLLNKQLTEFTHQRNHLRTFGKARNYTCQQPRMLLRPMVSFTDFGCYGITEEIEHSLHTETTGPISLLDENNVIDCEPVLDKLRICSSDSSSSSSSSSSSGDCKKKSRKRYERMSVVEDSSPIYKKEGHAYAKRRRLLERNVVSSDRLKPTKQVHYYLLNQTSGNTLCDIHRKESIQLGVCNGKSCCKNGSWQMVDQVISNSKLGDVQIETKPMKCKKLCSKNGVTVDIENKTFGNMTATTLYQVLNTWKQSENGQETVVRPAA